MVFDLKTKKVAKWTTFDSNLRNNDTFTFSALKVEEVKVVLSIRAEDRANKSERERR